MTKSALRRNIAELLGIASSAEISSGRYQPTPDEVRRVRRWLDGCEMAWIETGTESEAGGLEAAMMREWPPPLNKQGR